MIQYKINGQFFQDVEKQDITITVGGDGIDADISNIRLFNASKDLINTIISTGGYFDKIPFEVLFDNTVIFEGYISFRQSHNLADSCEFIELSVVKNDSKRGLEDISDLLTLIGGIASGDVITIPIPYQLSTIPDKQAVAIAVTGLFLTTYVFQEKLKNIIKEITLATTNPFTVNAAITLGIEIVYTSALLVAFIKYLIDLFNALISPVRNAPTYNYTNALNGLLNRLGYTLQSDFLFTAPINKLHIAHTIDTDGNIIDNSTLRDLLNYAKQVFNADISVRGNVVYINKDRSFGAPTTVITDYVLVRRELDLSECPSSILLRFIYDSSDKNTVTNGIGNSYQALFDRHGDAKVNEIQLSRAKRKDTLTAPEVILKAILEIADTVLGVIISTVNVAIRAINAAIQVFNRIVRALNTIGIRLNIQINPIPTIRKPDFSATIGNRIGNLLVEADTWGQNKLLLVNSSNDRVDENHKDIVNTKYIFDNYWNQRFVYEKWQVQIPICYDNFVQLTQDRYIQLDTDVFKVVEAQFNVNATIADLTLLKIVNIDNPPVTTIIQ
jgi:hypothetical protein